MTGVCPPSYGRLFSRQPRSPNGWGRRASTPSRLRDHAGLTQRGTQPVGEIRFVLIEITLLIGDVPTVKQPHFVDLDPSGRAIDEHLIAARWKSAAAITMLRHVLVGVATRWIRIKAPFAFDLHDGVRRECPMRPGGAQLDRAKIVESAHRIHPAGDATIILIADDPLVEGLLENRQPLPIGTSPDGDRV